MGIRERQRETNIIKDRGKQRQRKNKAKERNNKKDTQQETRRKKLDRKYIKII